MIPVDDRPDHSFIQPPDRCSYDSSICGPPLPSALRVTQEAPGCQVVRISTSDQPGGGGRGGGGARAASHRRRRHRTLPLLLLLRGGCNTTFAFRTTAQKNRSKVRMSARSFPPNMVLVQRLKIKALFFSIQVLVLTMQQESIARQETGGSFIVTNLI